MFLGCRRHVLSLAGSFLAQLVNILHRTHDLFGSFGHFFHDGGYFPHLFGNFLDRGKNIGKGLAGRADCRRTVFHFLGTGVHRLHRLIRLPLNIRDHPGDLFSGFPRLFRQLADFIGHHGEPSALLAGPGRFDSRVESQ